MIKAEALAEIEIAPRGLPVPSNPDQQTLQSSPVGRQALGRRSFNQGSYLTRVVEVTEDGSNRLV